MRLLIGEQGVKIKVQSYPIEAEVAALRYADSGVVDGTAEIPGRKPRAADDHLLRLAEI